MIIEGPGFMNGTIILEEPESVYYSGQLLLGNVHFELRETLNYSAINLVYMGEALVQRTEQVYEMSGATNRYRDVTYEGREMYFNYMQCISGGVGETFLPSGVHAIPFQFQVPSNVPSSFKEDDGIIHYYITAYLEYPEPGKREELRKEFQVVAPIYPNMQPNLMQPLELAFEEIETCNCFCSSKPIDMKISLPSAAFHVGSSIPITVKVKNESSVEIYEITFRVIKRHTYRTTQPRSEYTAAEETLAEMKKGPVLSDTRRQYTWPLELPPALQPNLAHCGIMDVNYWFKVKIQMTGCNEDVEDEAEIFIGVLPGADAVTSPELARQLPKAPVPSPIDLPTVGLAPHEQNPATIPQINPQIVAPSQGVQKSPYEIGFRSPTILSQPPYPVSHSSSGYPPYPAASAATVPYPSNPLPYNLSTSQPNFSPAPSAPPL